jgi:nicotinate-nucleotide--dimethylbenzimidazole phosphoribosyltransferase
VSAYPREVTAEMMRNFARGGAAINVIAATNDVSVEVVDVGVDADLEELVGITHAKIRRGSRNLAIEPAMTTDELDAALSVGATAARRAAADGVGALGLGEMGIGNSTTAAALLVALTGVDTAIAVGRGTGVTDDVLTQKLAVVERACGLHVVSANGNPSELLRCLGGFELAAIAGAALEAARLRIAVVTDGFISTVAILCAMRIAQCESMDALSTLARALFFAHRSAEKGHALALDSCGVLSGCDARPLLDLNMRLGEGSGAALAMPILRAAAAIMRDMATFESAGVSRSESN